MSGHATPHAGRVVPSRAGGPATARKDAMERYDFVIIGAGPAGEAAAYEARERGASVAVVDRDLFGGSCPHWGCVPSKSLLNGAARHAAGGDYPWSRASARRDYMINREGRDYPDDAGHVRGLEAAGARVYRGEGRLAGPGRVAISGGARDVEVEAQTVILAVGSATKVPPVDGIETIRTWTNREATATRDLPRSLLVLGGGPDRRRDRPGLRQVRRADGDRAVGRPAPAPRPPAQQRSGPAGARGRWRPRPPGCSGAARAGRGGRRRGRRHRPGRRLDGRRSCGAAGGRAGRSRSRASGSTRSGSTRAIGRRSLETAACGSPTASISLATWRVRSCTPTRRTTRA